MKINLNNPDKVEEQLGKVNGRANTHVICTTSDLLGFAREAEISLAVILPKAGWKGARVLCRPKGPSKGTLEDRRVSTTCVLERGARDWFLVGAESAWVYPRARRLSNLRAPRPARLRQTGKPNTQTEPADSRYE